MKVKIHFVIVEWKVSFSEYDMFNTHQMSIWWKHIKSTPRHLKIEVKMWWPITHRIACNHGLCPIDHKVDVLKICGREKLWMLVKSYLFREQNTHGEKRINARVNFD